MHEDRTALADAMAAHKIIVDPIAGDGFHLQDGWEHHRFRFALYVGSFDEAGMILSNAIYRHGMGHDEDPTPVDVFGAVLMDIASIAGASDWVDWADELGCFSDAVDRDRIRKLESDYREINARRSLIVERIGEDALDELLELAREL